MTLRIVHKNSSASGKNPTAAQLANGELSINYHSDGPFLSVKDTAGNIIRVGGVWINNNSPPDPKKGALWVDPDNNILYVRDDSQWIPIAGGGGGGGGGGDITAVTEGPGIDVQNSAGPIPKVSVDLSARSGLQFAGAGDAGTLQVHAGTLLEIDAGTGALNCTAGGLTYVGVVSPDDDGDLQDANVGEIYACDVTTVNATNPVTAAWYTCITNLASPADVAVGDLLVCTTAGNGTAANSRYTRLATGAGNQITTINANEGLTATVTGGNTVNLAVDLHTSVNGNDSGLETDPAGNDGELRVKAGAGLDIIDDGGANQGDLVVDAANIPLPNGGDGTGDFGYWNRAEPAGGDVLSPRTAGDDVFTSGDLRIGNTAASPRALISGATGEIRSATLETGDEVTTGTGLAMADDTGDLVRSAPGDGLEINNGRLQADLLVDGGLRLTANDGTGELAVDAANMPAPEDNQSFGYWTRASADNTLTPRTGTDIVMVDGGTAAAPTLAHAGDLDTGIAFAADDQVNITTRGQEKLRVTGTAADTGAVTVNPGNLNVDFLVEPDDPTQDTVLHADVSTNRVGIGVVDPTTKLHVDGNIQSTSQNDSHLAGFRNMLINGGFQVFQRGFNGSTTGVDYVTADMWRIGDGVGSNLVNVGRVDGPDEFANGVSIDRGAQFQNRIELPAVGRRGKFQNGSVWTLSFWSTETNLANFGATVFFGQTNTIFGAGWTVQTALTEVGTSGIWRKYAMTVICDQAPAATDIWTSVTIVFSAAAAIAGVQFEPGPVFTPFEYRPLAVEEAMCERYFFRAPPSYVVWSGFATTGAGYNVSARLPTTQRLNPPATINNFTSLQNNNFNGGVFASTLPGANTDENVTIASVATGTGEGYFFAGFDASSEL